jgi:hypothetical protein
MMTRYSVGVDIGSAFTDVACAEFGVDPAARGRNPLAGTYRHRGALKPTHP